VSGGDPLLSARAGFTAAWSSPCDVQVQAGADVVDLDLFRARALRGDAVVPGCAGSESEGLAVRDEVRCAPREVERPCRSTHLAVAISTATTAGEMKARTLGQEGEDVSAGVGSKASQDESLTLRHRHFGPGHSTPLRVGH
jgi:hypothetical protein